MKRINNVPLSLRAADEIRKSIISGEYSQGQKLTEEELAAQLGLSRVCVREAFLILKEEGLITKEVNKSTSVTRFTEKDVKDIYYLRLSLEKMCSTLCYERGTLPLKKLEEILSRMVKISEKEKLNPMELLTEDLNFHAAIVDAADNSRAAKVWHDIRSQSLAVLFPVQADYSKKHDKTHNVDHHRFLLEAIKTQDTAVSHPVLERHILSSMNTLLDLYGKKEQNI